MNQKTPAILLLIGLFLYSSQGVLYEGGNLYTRVLLLIIFLIAAYYFIKLISSSMHFPVYLKYWIALLLLNIMGYLFTGSKSDPIHFSMFRGILITLLTFFPFYYFSNKGWIQKKHLILFLLFITPILIQNWILTRESTYVEYGREEIVNNMSYILIMLIPFLFLFDKRKYIANVLLLIIMYYVVLGSKRGAVIVGGLATFLYMYGQIKIDNLKKHVVRYVLGVIAILIVTFYNYQFFNQNEYLLSRFEQLDEGNSSGRDVIYANIFSNWANSESVVNKLFGYGFAGSVNLSGLGLAHNDWLELLSNFGLLGVGIYFLFFYHAYKFAIQSNLDSQYKLMLLCILTMWLATSFFSMGYVSNDGYLRSMLLGFILGRTNLKRKVNLTSGFSN